MVLNGQPWTWVSGGGGNEAVLLLTGGSQVAESWFELMPRFERRFRVLAPNYPSVETMDDLVEGLRALLDAEGVARVHVVGSSMGGFVAQAFMSRHPDRVARLVLAETTVPQPSLAWRVQAVRRLAAIVPSGILKAYLRRRYNRSVASGTPARRAFLAAHLDHYFRHHGDPSLIANETSIITDFFRNYRRTVRQLRKHAGRILIVDAARDQVIGPDLRKAIRRSYRGAAVATLNGSQHAADLAHPRLWSALVLRFLSAGPQPTRAEA